MKKLFTIIFLLSFLFSCSAWDNQDNQISNQPKSENIENQIISDSNFSNEKKTIDVEKNNFSNILLNIWEVISEKDFFSYFVYGNKNIIFANKDFIIPEQEKDFLDWFKSHFEKRFIIENLKTSKEVLSSNIEKNYKWESSNYLFLNKNKDYLFNLANFYEMNGVCQIVFWEINNFTDTNGENVKPESELTLQWQLDFYKKELNWEILFLQDLEKNDTNYDFIEKKLFTYVSLYLEKNDKKYLEKFLEDFDKNLSVKYSYEVYSLFFEIQKQLWNDKNFCDKFNREYFLWI